MIDQISLIYGRFLERLALLGCAILMAMMLLIVVDVALRNLAIPGLPMGLAWSTEVSELMLYLITMCVAPWLLRQGQHIRVDIMLQAIPRQLAWYLEWVGDMIGFACCIVIAWFGTQAAWSSYLSGAVNIKTLVTPEWWALAPLPLVFVLLGIEMIFRMIRLQRAERGPRHDAVGSA
ncbi:TRAP-type C4-dicarboxylate transport system, small permease component [Polaromonas sp. OV174]|uniref:TRAP transporter small permease n=1 Tax=Polaromonas sp. OV174 TaxID=1855300 RepID=UPI0008EC0497|nr:TRAP transporter small permease [Polaromonas sp. OV174]SFC28369.1 TRAP-type C4-dicarboxylate transport system, small permease component [Polaromonas sp. OV174]